MKENGEQRRVPWVGSQMQKKCVWVLNREGVQGRSGVETLECRGVQLGLLATVRTDRAPTRRVCSHKQSVTRAATTATFYGGSMQSCPS